MNVWMNIVQTFMTFIQNFSLWILPPTCHNLECISWLVTSIQKLLPKNLVYEDGLFGRLVKVQVGIGYIELLHCSTDTNETDSPLLFQISTLAGQDSFDQADDKHYREFEAFGAVYRRKLNSILVVCRIPSEAVGVGKEGFNGVVLRGGKLKLIEICDLLVVRGWYFVFTDQSVIV